jgi:CDP-glycerol glycerophosphotransferase (TagB/SpsB family)
MNERQVRDYFDFWRSLTNATVHDAGGYAHIFAESDAMITDSGSFLVEYGMTGNPIIRLRSPDEPDLDARFTRLGRQLVETLYHAEDVRQLNQRFREIILLGNDPKRDKRLSTRILRSVMNQENAGAAIADEIARELVGG